MEKRYLLVTTFNEIPVQAIKQANTTQELFDKMYKMDDEWPENTMAAIIDTHERKIWQIEMDCLTEEKELDEAELNSLLQRLGN